MFLTTWFVSNLLLMVLTAQLLKRQVYFELPLFFACTAFRLIQAVAITIALNRFQFLSTEYRLAWLVTEFAAIILVALATAECYLWLTRRIFRLGAIGVGAVAAAVLIGVVAMVGTSMKSSDDLSRNLAIQFQFKQSMMGFLAVSLAVLLAFYRRFPLHVPRQAWPHALTQLGYLAVHSLAYGTMVVGGHTATASMNEILPIAWIGCLAIWFWIFRRGVTWPEPPTDGNIALERADEQAKRLERML